MLYATLTEWGMHRMGDSDKTKTKLVDWDAFRTSLLAQRDTFVRLRHLRLLDLSEDDYANALTELETAYRKLKLSASGATVVVNSKALCHVLPHLVPPRCQPSNGRRRNHYNSSPHAPRPRSPPRPYVVEAPIGAGGMSACGRGERVEPQRVEAFSRRNARMREAASVGGWAPTRWSGPARILKKQTLSPCR